MTRFNESQTQLTDTSGQLVGLGSVGTVLVAGRVRDEFEVAFEQTSIQLSFPG